MTVSLHDWNAKLISLEKIIDHRVNENIKNYDVLDQLPVIIKDCISVQLSVMLGFALSCPQLAKLPETSGLNHVTIYDIIKSNMEDLLLAHGEQYFKEHYAESKN